MRFAILLSLFVGLRPCSAEKIPANCQKWFSKQKIEKAPDCSLKCSMAESDMGTFDCNRFCDVLCGAKPSNFGFQISNVYPGLTDAEREFVDQNPTIAAKAYWLSWRAESACKSIYKRSDTNDESDACRHFMWAVFLNQDFGEKTSMKILDAHEQNDSQPESEKAMDLANNRRGILISTEIIAKSKKVTEADFLEQFKKDIIDGKLIVLKRRTK